MMHFFAQICSLCAGADAFARDICEGCPKSRAEICTFFAALPPKKKKKICEAPKF